MSAGGTARFTWPSERGKSVPFAPRSRKHIPSGTMDLRAGQLSLSGALILGTGTAMALTGYWWLWSKRHHASSTSSTSILEPKDLEELPRKWRRVGDLSELYLFPVKSCQPMEVPFIETTTLGPKLGWLRDRTFMVVNLDNHFVSGRQLPKLVLIKVKIFEALLTLNAPGMSEDVSVDITKLRPRGNLLTMIWGQFIPAYDCGDQVAKWLSLFLKEQETGYRLVYYPLEKPTKEVMAQNRIFPNKQIDTGAYSDSTSFSLQNHASIADLSARIGERITNRQLRSNFVVKGPKPYEEDTWEWIKIGGIVFRNIKPCIRCIFTTVNPDTGIKHEKMEPLKTLKTYRIITDPKIKPFTKESPVMGIHLGIRSSHGIIQLGDAVYVGVPEKKSIRLS